MAKDLPEKTEQTIQCNLEPKHRKMYDELRDYYRRALLDRVDKEGLAKSKIIVLEALLRLRQAACHPGLLDEKKASEPSAKKSGSASNHQYSISMACGPLCFLRAKPLPTAAAPPHRASRRAIRA